MSRNRIVNVKPVYLYNEQSNDRQRLFSDGLCRLACAVAIDRQFFEALKSDPQETLAGRYLGKDFRLLDHERQWIVQGHFDTPQEFGVYLVAQAEKMMRFVPEFVVAQQSAAITQSENDLQPVNEQKQAPSNKFQSLAQMLPRKPILQF